MRWLKDHARDLTDDLRKQIASEIRVLHQVMISVLNQ